MVCKTAHEADAGAGYAGGRLLEKIAKKNARFDKLFYLMSALEFPDFVTI